MWWDIATQILYAYVITKILPGIKRFIREPSFRSFNNIVPIPGGTILFLLQVYLDVLDKYKEDELNRLTDYDLDVNTSARVNNETLMGQEMMFETEWWRI